MHTRTITFETQKSEYAPFHVLTKSTYSIMKRSMLRCDETVKIQEDVTNDLISSASPGHRLLLLFYWAYFINAFILEPLAELRWCESHRCQSIRMKVNIFSPLPVRPPPFVWMDGWKGGACFGMSKIHHYRGICCSAPKSVDTNLCGKKKVIYCEK